MVKDYTREEWEKLGLLESTPDDRKDNVVKALNTSLHWMDEKHEATQDIPGFSDKYETMPIPIIVGIVKEVDVSDEGVRKICDEIVDAYEKYDFGKFNGIPMDIEAEFMCEFRDKKVEELKNK